MCVLDYSNLDYKSTHKAPVTPVISIHLIQPFHVLTSLSDVPSKPQTERKVGEGEALETVVPFISTPSGLGWGGG